MAGLNRASGYGPLDPLARAQYAAVRQMRWRMLVNSLRTKQGKFELGARIFATAFFAILWLGMGLGCGVLAHQIAADRQMVYLPALLWPIFLLWQVAPILLSAAQQSLDLDFLLRFPVSFRSYLLLYLSLGLFDPSSMLGGICLLGVWIGVVLAIPAVVLWLTVILAAFAVFNFLLTRMIFAWIERWLAQRRTRELLGLLGFGLLMTVQFLNPALHPHSIGRGLTQHAVKTVERVQQFLPPGMAGSAVAGAAEGRSLMTLASLAGLLLYCSAAGGLLALRLRAQSRGESSREAPAHSRTSRANHSAPSGDAAALQGKRRLSWLDGPVAGILGKELRSLARSGIMLFGLITPLVLIFAAGSGLRRSMSGTGGAPGGLPPISFAFPLAIAYGFLPLTRQFCNSLGTEGSGIQLYFLSPTPFRSVMLAKNLLQSALFGVELVLVASASIYRFGAPSATLATATFCWVLFALPANLAAGNVLSITLAYRMTLTRLAREQGSVGNGLLSLLVQVAIFAVGVAVYLSMERVRHPELAAPVLLVLAVASWFIWRRVLTNVDAMAAARRELLMATLVRPA